MKRAIKAAIILTLLGTHAQAEPVQFNAAPVNPTPLQQRLARQNGTTAAPHPGDPIQAQLYRPHGPGPFPALVALHGCLGPLPPEAERQQLLPYIAHGYAVLAVDSFAPRGIAQACTPYGVGADRIGDAFGALDWLANQPFIDPARIAVLGFGQGADVALFAVSPEGAAQGYPRHFAAALAYYPVCSPTFAHLLTPALILIGDADDWSRARDCRAMLHDHANHPTPMNLVILPGAAHAFDQVTLANHPEERFGHHLEYNEPAAATASETAQAFLKRYLPSR